MKKIFKVFIPFFICFTLFSCAEPYSPVKDIDSTPPEVSGTSPADQESDVPADISVEIKFSKTVLSSTVHSSSIKMTCDNAVVPAEVTVLEDGITAQMVPLSELIEGKEYTVEIERSITDTNGLPLKTDGTDSPYVFSFTVVSTIPSITGTNPADSEVVSAETLEKITVTFSEDMDPATINESTFFVEDVFGTVEYDAGTKTASLSPDTKLMSSTSYTLILTNGIKDLAGISIQNTSVNFSTAEE